MNSYGIQVFVTFFMLNACSACWKTDVTFYSVDGSYSFEKTTFADINRLRRPRYVAPLNDIADTSQMCSLRSGFADLNVGFIPNAVTLKRNEVRNRHSILFDLTCDKNSINDQGYVVPGEVKDFLFLLNVIECVGQRLYTSLQELIDSSGETDDTWIELIKNIAATGNLRRKYSTHEEALTHMLIFKVDYVRYKLKQNLSATNALQTAFENLPENYSDNPSIYHRFIQQFGSFYKNSATLGGKATLIMQYDGKHKELIHNHILNPSIPDIGKFPRDLLKALEIKFKSPLTRKFIVSAGGNFALATSWSSWVESIMDAPVVLDSVNSPINSLIQLKTVDNLRHASFLKATQDENIHQKMKKMKLQLYLSGLNSTLGLYFEKLVDEEVNFIQPDLLIHKTIKEAFVENPALKKYFIACMASKTTYYGQTSERNVSAYGVNGVCVTLGNEFLKNDVNRCDWNPPTSANCVKVFFASRCDGNGALITKAEQLTNYMPNVKSFKFCQCTAHNTYTTIQ